MKHKRLLSILSCLAIVVNLLPGIAVFAEETPATLIASDDTTDWKMSWWWETYEDGWDYFADWNLKNGFEITYDKALYDELEKVDYPVSGDVEKTGDYTKVAASGEYKLAFKKNAAGKAVPYDSTETPLTNHLWRHQGRWNFSSKFTFQATVQQTHVL